MTEVKLIRLGIRVRPEDAEVALAELLALAPNGVEEIDEGDVIEYAIYGSAGEVPELPAVRAAAGDALVEVVTTVTSYDSNRWREFHRPVVVGAGSKQMRVRAPWHEPLAPCRGQAGDIVIDPGQAFGTGAHPTTRLCLELMVGADPPAGKEGGSRLCSGHRSQSGWSVTAPPPSVIDLGCGSGVLAIGAARLGWVGGGGLLCLDHDQLAVDATIANARDNGVSIEARRFDLRNGIVPAAAIVLANLLRPLLLSTRFAEPPQMLIASGLLSEEGDEIVAHFRDTAGLEQRRRVESDGWIAIELR